MNKTDKQMIYRMFGLLGEWITIITMQLTREYNKEEITNHLFITQERFQQLESDAEEWIKENNNGCNDT